MTCSLMAGILLRRPLARVILQCVVSCRVVLYAGNGMIYEEPDFGMSCQYVPLSSKGFGRMEVRRIVSD